MWTLEGLLLGVGPEVSHQRVPELKDLIAELTGEDLQLAFNKTWRRGGGDTSYNTVLVVASCFVVNGQCLTS